MKGLIPGIALVLFAAFAVQAASQPGGPVPAPTRAQTAAAKGSSLSQVALAAEQARTENREDDAIRLYQQGLKLKPDWDQGLWYLATILYDRERYSEARDLLRRFLALDPDAGSGWAILGMSEFQTREYPRALDHLQHARFLGVGDRKELVKSIFYFESVLLTRSEQYDESMDLLFGMVKSGQPTDPLVEPLGLAALRMPLLPSEIPVDRRSMIQSAGRAALALGERNGEEAERLLRGLVTAYPNEPGVHFFYGVFLLDVRSEDGIAEIKWELKISPTHVPARLRLAERYLKEQKVELALDLALEAVKLDSKHGGAHMMLGEALVAKGDAAGGIRELEMAREQLPQMVRIRWDLLRAYTAAGRNEDAKREKEEIEKLSVPESGRQPD